MVTSSNPSTTTESFVSSLAAIPHIGDTIRHSVMSEYKKCGSVPLCLGFLGPGLPHADQALGFKLFLEASEIRA